MVLVHAATQKHHFHVQLPKSTTVLGVPQLPSVVLLLFLMCSLDHDVAAFRGKWWRPQEVSLDSPSEKKWLILKLLHLLQLIFSSAGNFTRPRPKQEANMLKICLILSRQALPLPGMIDVGTLTGGANGSVNSAMWSPLFPARFLDPRSVLYCLFNRPNELQPLFGSLQLSLCFPKLEHCTEAVKVGCCPERAMALSESPCMAGLFSNHASEALEVSRPQKND